MGLDRNQIAWRIAQDIADGSYVNLGIGMPELVADFIPEGREIVFHSENGLLGMGPKPPKDQEDHDLMNAGKKPVTLVPGGAYFHHTDSFLMIRGGHLDLCVLGAYQISETGDLANWATDSDQRLPAVGGAMDLAAGTPRVVAMTTHCARDGAPKLLGECTFPLTAAGVVDRVYTDLAVVDVTPEGFVAREIIDGMTLGELQDRTGARLTAAETPGILKAPALGKTAG